MNASLKLSDLWGISRRCVCTPTVELSYTAERQVEAPPLVCRRSPLQVPPKVRALQAAVHAWLLGAPLNQLPQISRDGLPESS